MASNDYGYCVQHPRHLISNGVFDAPCPACEGEGDAYQEAMECYEAEGARAHGLPFEAWKEAHLAGCGAAAAWLRAEERLARLAALAADPIPF